MCEVCNYYDLCGEKKTKKRDREKKPIAGLIFFSVALWFYVLWM